ncbi:MAG: cytochrome P450 [Acidimicrobiales bacterium]|nr:cytochrome P450 [Acidimicrobiales bacterium]
MTGPTVVPLRSKEFWQDPYPILDAARAQHRTAVSESGEPVILSIADLEAVSAHPIMVPLGLEALDRLGITEGPFRDWRALSLNARDRDDHRRLRTLVGRAFTPLQTQRVRPLVREFVHDLLDELVDAGTMDVQQQFAREVPLFAICVFLGIPEEDRYEIEALHFGTEEGFGWPMTPERKQRADDGIIGLYDYSRRLVERRRSDPQDDLVTALVNVEEAGDRLSEDELLAMVVNLIGGAIGSTSSAITNAAYLFATHPDQARLLRTETSLDREAVEEVLRFAPPFRSTRRKALDAVEVAGLSLAPGDSVFLSRQAANRDPERFERPHDFDIRRGDTNHASFGHGPHFCLGQALARVNLTEAVPALVRRCTDLELDCEPARIPFDPVEKFDALTIRFRGASRP